MEKSKKIKTIKIVITAVLSAVDAYLIYGMIGNFVVWTTQPRFTNGAVTTSSLGFLVQFFIYLALFLALSTIIIICALKFFRKPKQAKN